MKLLRHILLGSSLVLALSIPAFAGDVHVPGLVGDVQAPAATCVAGEIGGPGNTKVAGEITTPGLTGEMLTPGISLILAAVL